MKNYIYHKMRNMKVFHRLSISLMFIAIIPLTIVTISSYFIYSDITTRRVIEYSNSLLNQSSQYIESELYRLESDIVTFAFMEETQEFLIQYPYLSESQRYHLINHISDDISLRISMLHFISDIILITNDKRNYINIYGGAYNSFDLSAVDFDNLFQRSQSSRGAALYGTRYNYEPVLPSVFAQDASRNYDRSGIFLFKQIRSSDSDIITGYLMLCIDETFISAFYEDWDFGDGSDIYIVDRQNRILSSSDKLAVGENFYDEELQNKLSIVMGSNTSTQVKGNNPDQKYLCSFSPIDKLGFYAIQMIPTDYLRNEAMTITAGIFAIVLVCIISSIMIAYMITKSISEPINKLIGHMYEVQGNQLKQRAYDPHHDELAVMSNTFNDTVLRLSELIDEVKTAEKEKMQLELKSLTAQINPHFLSNTLNSIQCLAHYQNAPGIESMIQSLSRLLHKVMGKSGDLITISEEIDLLNDYINLQKYKQFDEIDFLIDIDNNVSNCKVPCFTLQPLVENAIIHGFFNRHGHNQIIIKAMKVDLSVHLTITDNGIGFDEDTLSRLQRFDYSTPSDADKNHIGITNVNQRLKLAFGKPYGISIHSVKGLFSEIDIIIPYEEKEAFDD